MKPPTDPFEEELRALRPRAPGPQLAASISDALADAGDAPDAAVAGRRPRRSRRPLLLYFALGLSWSVAAAMTVAFIARPPQAAAPEGPRPRDAATADPAAAFPGLPPGFTPVSSTKTLVGTRDEGVVLLDDGRPARKVRLEFVDTINLLSTDASRATLDVSYPREEIRLVPVQAF